LREGKGEGNQRRNEAGRVLSWGRKRRKEKNPAKGRKQEIDKSEALPESGKLNLYVYLIKDSNTQVRTGGREMRHEMSCKEWMVTTPCGATSRV